MRGSYTLTRIKSLVCLKLFLSGSCCSEGKVVVVDGDGDGWCVSVVGGSCRWVVLKREGRVIMRCWRNLLRGRARKAPPVTERGFAQRDRASGMGGKMDVFFVERKE